MDVIAVECPACRSIQDVEPSCLLVEIGAPEEVDEVGSSASWICDTCRRLVALPIDLLVLLKLVAAGASLLDTALDDVLPVHPESLVDGSPFTFDDLLDFHEDLEHESTPAGALCREAPEECSPRLSGG
jgi:hypothetical protein